MWSCDFVLVKNEYKKKQEQEEAHKQNKFSELICVDEHTNALNTI